MKTKLPVKRDIEMKRNMDWNWTLRLRENDGVAAKNTTGYSMTMMIKSSANGEAYKTLMIGSGIIHTALSGQFNLTIPYSDINAFEFSAAVYDLVIINNLSKQYIPFYGSIRVIP